MIFNKRIVENQSEKKNEHFKSNNKIPKNVRVLMRTKKKISKQILLTKSVKKYLKLKENLEATELKLKESYIKRREKLENTAISKMKKDPRAFFGYAKKFSRTKSETGPFLDKEGDPVSDPEAIVEQLMDQY